MVESDPLDPERDLHICELKIRLQPADRALLAALARKLDVPPAVLARKFVRDGLAMASVPARPEMRRAC